MEARNSKLRLANSQDATFNALAEVSLEIMNERDKTEREIKRLAESGFRDQAWKLLVKHLKIKEPK